MYHVTHNDDVTELKSSLFRVSVAQPDIRHVTDDIIWQ